MAKQRSIASLFTFGAITIIGILMVIVMVVFIFSKSQNLEQRLARMEQRYKDVQLMQVKAKVNEVIQYIDFRRSQTEAILKNNIKEKVNYAHSMALSVYDLYRGKKSTAEIKEIIIDILRPIRLDGRGYYFIDDMDGNIVLYPTQRHREGKSGLNVRDIKGKYQVREFIQIAKTQGEGFASYHWHKILEQKKGPVKKFSFIKLFKPFNWIIGTGEYVEDVETDIKNEVMDRIRGIRFGPGESRYVFLLKVIGEKEGDPIVTNLINPGKPDWVGQPVAADFQDEKGNYFIKELKNKLSAGDDAVFTYYFQKPGTKDTFLKTSYARVYKGFGWIVGSGFYHDELQSLIAKRKSDMALLVKKEIYLTVGIFLLVSLLAGMISRIVAGKIKQEFEVLTTFFKESAGKNEILDKNRLKVLEFSELAESANAMIRDKRQSEIALVTAKETAEAATRAKSEFLANMSHEIRTPMNAIIGMSDILAQTPLNDEQYEYLEIITTSANNLLVIINDILDFSKIEAGQLNIDRINFSVRDVIESVADMISPKAHKKGVELISLIEPDIPQQILGDSARLHQIILNLANNAVKFTEEGEIVVSAEISDTFEADNKIKLLFKVKDSGIGISQEDQKHLFKTFSQVDTTSTRKYGGTGLGLAISKKLSELMGGQIGVESERGHGSTFWFTCIFDKSLDDAPAAFAPEDFKGLKVLVVDDNRTNRFILRKYLKARECDCDEATTAWEAIDKLEDAVETKHPFDVALLDFQMPEVSGAQLAEMIKANEKVKNIPLMLLSSATAYQTHEELREIGFDALLYKPIKQSQLFRGIAGVMGAARHEEKQARTRVSFEPKMQKEVEKPLQILLVEDNMFNQKVAIFNLKKFHHKVDLAENGKEAVDLFKKNEYDLVLMDVQMPVMDGYEATRIIRQLERTKTGKNGATPHTPIVAMTANAMKEDEEKAFKAGMDTHLAKPFSAEKFITVVHDMATRKNNKDG